MERTKVIVRKLPPNVAEADVRDLVNNTGIKYDWFSFVQGKTSVKRVVHSRCYVNFTDPADIPAFKAAAEGHVFVTDRGAQFRASVEFAPFQKIPEGKAKRDPREGTLDTDPDYLAFVEGLDALPEALPSAEVAGSSGQPPGPQVTALMAYLQEKHSLKKKAPVAIVSRSKADLKTGRRRSKEQGGAQEQASDYSRSPPKVLTKASRGGGSAEGTAQDRPKSSSSKRRSSKAGAAAAQVLSADPAESGSAATMASARQPRGSENVTAADDRPVRVRAGFQVYQPKRVGRLEPVDEASSERGALPGGGARSAQSTAQQASATPGSAKSAVKSASAAETGKEGENVGTSKKAAGSDSEKTRRRRPPKEGSNAKQGSSKGSPSKPAEPEGE